MKKPIKTILMMLLAVYAVSCGNNSEHSHEHNSETHVHEKENVKHEEPAKSDFTLELNAGNRWIANPETTEGIGKMVVIMDGFTDAESVDAYAKLSTDLNETLNTLLKECTMEGEPHNHLHTYLYPMFAMIEGIGSTDLETCKVNYGLLKAQLSEYPNYFE